MHSALGQRPAIHRKSKPRVFIESQPAEKESMELVIVIAHGGNECDYSMTRGPWTRLFLRASYQGNNGNPITSHRPGLFATTRHAIDLSSSFLLQTLHPFLYYCSCFLFYHGLLHQATRLSSIASVDKISSFSFRIHAVPWQKCRG